MPATPNAFISPQLIKTAVAVPVANNTTMGDLPTIGVLKLMTAGANGARVMKLTATPRATVTVTQLQLYISKDGGATKQFIRSKGMAAYTMAATTEAPSTDFGLSDSTPLLLGPNDELWVGIGVAQAAGIVFLAEYGDY